MGLPGQTRRTTDDLAHLERLFGSKQHRRISGVNWGRGGHDHKLHCGTALSQTYQNSSNLVYAKQRNREGAGLQCSCLYSTEHWLAGYGSWPTGGNRHKPPVEGALCTKHLVSAPLTPTTTALSVRPHPKLRQGWRTPSPMLFWHTVGGGGYRAADTQAQKHQRARTHSCYGNGVGTHATV